MLVRSIIKHVWLTLHTLLLELRSVPILINFKTIQGKENSLSLFYITVSVGGTLR